VTDIPGTTRDLIRADLDLEGLPVEIVDTAGLREAADAVEAEGVRRALLEAEQADVVLVVSALEPVSGRNPEGEPEEELPAGIAPDRVIRVLNKLDLAADGAAVGRRVSAAGGVAVSAATGEGFDALRARIRTQAGFVPGGNLFTARQRHLVGLDQAREAAERALSLSTGNLPGELIAEELRAVHTALGGIVGEMSSDALLGEIFSRFCIGK